jgi:hypothetical protein
MSAADVGWRFGLHVPEGWVDVDLSLPEDLRFRAIDEAVDALVAAEPGFSDDAVRMKNAAWSVVADAVAQRAMVAAVGFERAAGATAPMSVVAHQLAGDAPIDVEALARSLEDSHPRDITGREVTIVELPAGPAVRVHAISEGGDAAGGPLPVVEGVDHFIPVPGTPDMLLLVASTPAVAIGDLALPVFDAIAATVGFLPA